MKENMKENIKMLAVGVICFLILVIMNNESRFSILQRNDFFNEQTEMTVSEEEEELAISNKVKKHYIFILSVVLVFVIMFNFVLLYAVRLNAKIQENNKKKNDLVQLNSRYESILYHMLEMFESASLVSQTDAPANTKRIVYYTEVLGKEFQLEEHYLQKILQYLPIHDIGNIAVNNQILNNKNTLMIEDYKEIKKHVLLGHELVKKLKLGKIAENIVLYHHERWDGKGYPYHLQGEEIPLEARILHLVETYDVLRTERPYKKAYSHQRSIEIILEEKGKQFDPKLVEVFIKNHHLFDEYFAMSQELTTKGYILRGM
jgi:HD-GYP domain-containing protein (c-di-GMP phosphodiesterase class II)